MPYGRPTLTELIDQAQQDINSAQITDAGGNVLAGLLPQGVLPVLSITQAGMAYEHYGFLDWISLQSIPWSATGEFLEGWAALKGVTREPATATTGSVTFSGSPDGTDLPSGTGIVRNDGFSYVTTADVAVAAGTVTASMRAVTPGAAGNFGTNAVFLLASPIVGIQPQSIASAQVTVGADQELDGALRTRMLLAYAAPPQGGDRTDYIEWALAVPGVTRAWVTPNGMGAGTVVLYVMLDLAESAFAGFPQGTNGVAAAETRAAPATGDQLTVANAILPLQPVTSLLYVVAPTAQPVAFTVADLGLNNTAPMQAQIAAALTDMFFRLGQVGGTVNPTTGAAWAGIEPSDWYAALEAIPGLSEFKVTVPAAAIVPSSGNLLTLGTVTYVT